MCDRVLNSRDHPVLQSIDRRRVAREERFFSLFPGVLAFAARSKLAAWFAGPQYKREFISFPWPCLEAWCSLLTHNVVFLQELVPITEAITIPFDYHRFIIGAKGANVRHMMDEYDVSITIPPPRDESDQVTIVGTRPKVNRAIEALQEKVAEIEAENEDRVGY